MRLSDLIKDLHNVEVFGKTDVEIKGITYDSRKVLPGFVFVCIKGYKTDGHQFINEVIDKGAVGVVVERDVEIKDDIFVVKVEDSREALAMMSAAYFGYPSKSFKLIGVTGTNGKTTTTYLIKSILENKGYNVAILGTISNIIGNKEIEAKRTTPESYDLQEMFNEMKNAGTDYCVMEVSSHSLELKRVAACTFEVGIFTNLTRDHLDFHGTFENYLNAKAKLFKLSEVAAINIDDSYSGEMMKKISIPIIRYSLHEQADITAENVEITSAYSKFTLRYKEEGISIMLPLPGRFNVYNALGAACACISQGISLEDIKKGLEAVKGVPGRSQVVNSGRGFNVIIDYAHTPDGIENILNTVREYAKGRIITIFGCGGDRDKTKRPMMGEVAGRLSDFTIVTSDNPRTEDPEAIINDILPGIQSTKKDFKIIVDRRCAIKEALKMARKDDVVVIAGKGHETYQILKDKTIHFDEREIVGEILNNEI